MKKNLGLILLMFLGISLFSDTFVGIYLFLIAVPIVIAAKCSNLFGIVIIILAILKMLNRYFKNKSNEKQGIWRICFKKFFKTKSSGDD
jgi:predicted ABC-type exoprotein transport system permease subunit